MAQRRRCTSAFSRSRRTTKNRKGKNQGKGWRDDWDAMARKTVMRRLLGRWGVMSIDYKSASPAALKAAHDISAGLVDDESPLPDGILDVTDTGAAHDTAENAPKTRNNKKPQGLNPCAWSAQLGEQPRDVKRRTAIRGGSIPPRAEQQEKSIFCKHASRLKRYSPQKGGHRAGKFTLAARKDEQNHFFGQPERRQIKYVSRNGPAVGLKRRHSWQAWKASRGCNTPLFVKVSSFLPFSCRLTRSTLPHVPGSIPGLAAVPPRKENLMLDYLKIFPEFEMMLRRYTDEERGRLFMA